MRWIGKILFGILILLGSTYLIFLLFNLMPIIRYGHHLHTGGYPEWLLNAIKGDFGRSLTLGEPVIDVVKPAIARTLLLNATAFIVSLIVSIPIGILSATGKSNLSKYFTMFFTAVATAVPAYIIGLFLIYNLSTRINWFPINGMRSLLFQIRGYHNIWQEIGDIARHMILPVFAMSVVMVGTFVPFIRNALLEVLHQDYIRTAKAKGLAGRVILFKHALKNAILPFISVAAMMLPGLIMSNIFIETVFRWPGVGMMFIEAIYNFDVYLVATIVLFYAALTLLGSFLSDFLSTRMDPRIKEVIAA